MDGTIRLHRDNLVFVTFAISADGEVILGTLDDYSREAPIILIEDTGKSAKAVIDEYGLYGFEPYT
jgi:hypothetical protein